MNKFIKLSITFALSIFIFSCGSNLTITKKSYSPGYNIDWNKGNSNAEDQKAIAAKQAKKTEKLLAQTKPLPLSQTPLNIYLPSTEDINLSNTNNTSVVIANKTEEVKEVIKHNVTEKVINTTFKENKISGAKKFILKKALNKVLNNKAETDTVLLVILAFFIPPLAVYLYEGNTWTGRCTLNLILTLLCGIPGFIHALILILGNK